MTAPVQGLQAADESTAEALLGSFENIAASERRKHATVYNYWLSIRRGRDVPPIRDLDPLEISDVAPSSLLLELVGGEDAEIRHLGTTLKSDAEINRIADAPQPSVLSSIAGKLGTVASSRGALAFEDIFAAEDGLTRCSVTLLPFSTTGDAVDFVYGLVTVETGVTLVEPVAKDAEPELESAAESEIVAQGVPDEVEEAECEPQAVEVPEPAAEETVADAEPVPPEVEVQPFEAEPAQRRAAVEKPGFSSKVFDALAGAKGFFGTVVSAEPEPAPAPVTEESQPVTEEFAPVDVEPMPIADQVEPEVFEPVAEEPPSIEEILSAVTQKPAESPHFPTEGTLQSKLVEVRGKAEEARAAKLRAEAALVEGLSAAYDFALDAEDAPEEYLKLVEAQGVKIQLRSPMAPVVKLAFDGSCDESTIKQLEAVLGWALKMELPRGSLAERIAAEGGIGSILNG